MGKIHDVSLTITSDLPVWPGEQGFLPIQTQSMDAGDTHNNAYFTIGMHSGTHVDVPRHFVIDGDDTETVSLTKYMGQAKVIELDEPVRIGRDVVESLNIVADDILLFKIRKNTELLKCKEFCTDFVYLSPEAAAFLAEKKIKGVGINYLSIEQFGLAGNATHKILLEHGIAIYEGLNLENITAGPYRFICLPLKLHQGNGSPARAILIAD